MTPISGDELARHHGHEPGKYDDDPFYLLGRLQTAVELLAQELPADQKPRVGRVRVLVGDLSRAISAETRRARERESSVCERVERVGGIR